MKNLFSKSQMLRYLFTLLVLSSTLGGHAESEKMINNAGQLGGIVSTGLGNLLDGDNTTIWESGKGSANSYLEVTFAEEQHLEPNEDWVIYVQRHTADNLLHPTILQVRIYDETKNDWVPFSDPVTRVFFLFRGKGTKEYSTRIYTTKTFTKVRFWLEATNGKSVTNTEIALKLAEFQIYKLTKDDDYPDGRKDTYRLTKDYYDNYDGYSFENSRGIFESRLHMAGAFPDTWSSDWSKWGKWEYSYTDKEGKTQTKTMWGPNPATHKKEADKLIENDVELPDYTMIDLGKGQKRQPTHIFEHTYYAIPGDVVALYPFYQIYGNQHYEEKFVHWYSYVYNEGQGGWNLKDPITNADMLDFLVDPSRIHRTKKNGFFGGYMLKHYMDEDKSNNVVEIGSAQEWINFANNNENANKSIRLTADIDFGNVEYTAVAGSPMLGRGEFNGSIDGGGHVIRNLKINIAENNIGLIRQLGQGAQVSNLIIDSSCEFTGNSNVGVIGDGGNGSIVEGVINMANVTATLENGNAGGIIGQHGSADEQMVIRNCGVGGTIKSGGTNAAAISGWFQKGLIENYCCPVKHFMQKSKG